MSHFSERLRLLRQENRYKQREMADILGLKLRGYQEYEYGNAYPTVPGLIQIAEFFQVSTDYLLGRADRTGPSSETGYYFDAETARLAQEMYEDKDMRSLFDMKRNMPPERFKAHLDFMKNLYEQEKGQRK